MFLKHASLNNFGVGSYISCGIEVSYYNRKGHDILVGGTTVLEKSCIKKFFM